MLRLYILKKDGSHKIRIIKEYRITKYKNKMLLF